MGEKDDFFGIEYTSSTSFQPQKEEMKKNEIEPSKRRILKEQPSGTDYLDEQFFPGIEKYERRNEATENETEAGNRLNLENTDDSQQDYFSHQYFNKRKQDPRDFQRRPRDENFQLNEENDNQSRGPEFERRKSMFKAEPSENDEFKGQKRVFNKKNDSRGFVRRPRTENFESYEKEEQENQPRRVENWKNERKAPKFQKMEVLPDDEESGLETKPLNGIQEIRSRLPPLWELKLDQLAEFMANRVLYNDGEIIAFDKPFGMAYSGSKENRPQFDRILQAVKAKVAPKCERLYVVRAPPKDESGVMVFAKSASVQSVLQGQIKDGLSQQVYRTIVRGVLPKDDLTIDIPLIKRVEGGDMKMIQLKSNNQRGEILYVKTNCKTITRDKYISQLEAVTTAEVSHQVRAHLGYSKCPLIGEPKYISTSPRPPKLPNYTLGLLNISENHTRKLPMFLHCKQVTYQPLRANAEPIRIGVPVPDHFNFVLKRLRILKKAARF